MPAQCRGPRVRLAPHAGNRVGILDPRLPGLRVDTHCEPGTVVPPYYDSLLAKLIGHADDREAAIDVLLAALEETEVEGVPSNRALLMDVLGHRDFRAATVTTDWLERTRA